MTTVLDHLEAFAGEITRGWQVDADGRKLPSPVYFPEEFWQVAADGIGGVLFAWLIPLLDDEVLCLTSQGVSALESRLESEDPDLADYTRGTPKQPKGYAWEFSR